MKTWLAWLCVLAGAAACDDGEQSLGETGECETMAAHGDGQCDQGLGVTYSLDGACIAIAGCQCVGADCDQLFETFQDCQNACLAGQPCQPTQTGNYCPDNGFCRDGVCVYQ